MVADMDNEYSATPKSRKRPMFVDDTIISTPTPLVESTRYDVKADVSKFADSSSILNLDELSTLSLKADAAPSPLTNIPAVSKGSKGSFGEVTRKSRIPRPSSAKLSDAGDHDKNNTYIVNSSENLTGSSSSSITSGKPVSPVLSTPPVKTTPIEPIDLTATLSSSQNGKLVLESKAAGTSVTCVKSPSIAPVTCVKSPSIAPVTSVKSPSIAPVTCVKSPSIAPVTCVKSSSIAPVTCVKSPSIAPVTCVKSPSIAPVTCVKSPSIAPVTCVKSSSIAPVTSVKSSSIAPVTSVKSSSIAPVTSVKSSSISSDLVTTGNKRVRDEPMTITSGDPVARILEPAQDIQTDQLIDISVDPPASDTTAKCLALCGQPSVVTLGDTPDTSLQQLQVSTEGAQSSFSGYKSRIDHLLESAASSLVCAGVTESSPLHGSVETVSANVEQAPASVDVVRDNVEQAPASVDVVRDNVEQAPASVEVAEVVQDNVERAPVSVEGAPTIVEGADTGVEESEANVQVPPPSLSAYLCPVEISAITETSSSTNSDELDSTSTISLVSDPDDSVQACYSKDFIKALMSKDGKEVLKAISQKMSQNKGLSAASHTSSTDSTMSSSTPSTSATASSSRSKTELLELPTTTTVYSKTVDSFFGADMSRASRVSNLPNTYKDISDQTGLTATGSAVFCDNTGLSISSLQSSPRRTASPTVPPAADTYNSAITSTVGHHLFPTDTETAFSKPLETVPESAVISSTLNAPLKNDTSSLKEQSSSADVSLPNSSSRQISRESAHHSSSTDIFEDTLVSSKREEVLDKTLTPEKEVPEVERPQAIDSPVEEPKTTAVPVEGPQASSPLDKTAVNTFSRDLSSLCSVTPGNPVCESSHLVKPTSAADVSGGVADQSAKGLSWRSHLPKPVLSNLVEVEEGDGSKSIQVHHWLSSQCTDYVTQSDAVTMYNQVTLDLTTSRQQRMTSMDTTLHTMNNENTANMTSRLCVDDGIPVVTEKVVERLIEVPDTLVVPGYHCTLTNTNVNIPITNLCDRWLQVSVSLTHHMVNGKESSTNLLFFKLADTLIKPSTTSHLSAWLNTAVPGRHEANIVVKVEGETTMLVQSAMCIDMESPSIELVDNKDHILEFGSMLFGQAKSIPLTLTNTSNVPATLLLKVLQDPHSRCYLELGLGSDSSSSSKELSRDGSDLKVTLGSHLQSTCTQTLSVTIKSPDTPGIDGSPEVLEGVIGIYQASAITRDPLLTVSTACVCGYASIQLPNKYHMFEMWCEAQSQTRETVPIMNRGDVPVSVTLAVDNRMFSVSPEYLELRPRVESSFILTFSSHDIEDPFCHVNCSVTACIEPNGPVSSINVRGLVNTPPSIPALSRSSPTHTLLPALLPPAPAATDSMKLKLKCAPDIIRFAGADMNRKKYITVRILNLYERPMHLVCDVNEPHYRIVSTSIDGKEQLLSTKEVVVPASSSAHDFWHLRLVFEPSKTGVIKSRLKCSSLANNIRFRLPIYGYGGISHVEPSIQTPVKDSGVYDLSTGELKRNNFTHDMFLRNVGYHKAFVIARCYSGPSCTQRLESTRIQVQACPMIVSPADARKLMINMKITEREKVLCEHKSNIIATIKFSFVDNILRQLLQRIIAVRPELCDDEIAPFLQCSPDDIPHLELPLPDDACNVRIFKSSIRSFMINIHGEPEKVTQSAVSVHSLADSARSHQIPAASLVGSRHHLSPVTSNLLNSAISVSARSLTFITDKAGDTRQLTFNIRNRSTEDVQVEFSQLASPFKCKVKKATLKFRNKGTIRIDFTATCPGTWEEVFTISTPVNAFNVTLIGKCLADSSAAIKS